MGPQSSQYASSTSLEITLNRDAHRHQQNQLKEHHSFEKDKLEMTNAHIQALENIKLGRIGRWFGSSENSSKSITAVICCLLLVGGGFISCYAYIKNRDVDLVKAVWASISPILTLSLGYLFGKK